MSSKPPLESLPTELICTVLSKLDGVSSLHSAILTCHRLRDCFHENASVIITRVILNHLDSWDIRHEALAAWEASKRPTRTATSVREFYAQYLSKRETDLSISLTLDEAVTVAKLQSSVERLADAFVEHSRQKLLSDGSIRDASQWAATTASEKGRIMRALYRFEIFCNLFRHPPKGSPRSEETANEEHGPCMREFLACFSPWENEQLACVFEFLFLKVAPAFNEVARHDIEWGEFHVTPARSFDAFWFRSVLFRGLDTLASISEATTYDRKYELLKGTFGDGDYRNNLYGALKALSLQPDASDTDYYTLVGTYRDADDYAGRVKPPFFQDPDDGPFEIWKWAYEFKPVCESFFERDQASLRKWGYVMWDEERLDALGVLQQRWQPSLPHVHSAPDDPERGGYGETWDASWHARTELYLRGARGWWDFDDHSKIVWTRGKPGEKRDTRLLPGSVEEAKKALLAMSGAMP